MLEIHLAGILRRERPDLEIEGDEGLEEPVVEKEIAVVFFATEDEPVLAPDETKAVAQRQNEGTQARDKPVLQLAFAHGPAEAEKFEVVAALERFLGLLGKVFREGGREVVRLARSEGTLESPGLDLVEQDVAGTAEPRGGAEVVEAGGGGFDLLDDLDVVPPRDCGQQFLNKLVKNC